MKFIAKRFMPTDSITKENAIFIVGEAKGGNTRYVALIDLYNPKNRWVILVFPATEIPIIESSDILYLLISLSISVLMA